MAVKETFGNKRGKHLTWTAGLGGIKSDSVRFIYGHPEGFRSVSSWRRKFSSICWIFPEFSSTFENLIKFRLPLQMSCRSSSIHISFDSSESPAMRRFGLSWSSRNSASFERISKKTVQSEFAKLKIQLETILIAFHSQTQAGNLVALLLPTLHRTQLSRVEEVRPSGYRRQKRSSLNANMY